MQDALADWRGGRTSWEHWGDSTDAARAAFAELVHVTPADVAIARPCPASSALSPPRSRAVPAC
jgi:selenocysteine lyase/cysteine desulfurase